MVRGAEMDKAVEEGLPRGKRALLGFNEPNFPENFWLRVHGVVEELMEIQSYA